MNENQYDCMTDNMSCSSVPRFSVLTKFICETHRIMVLLWQVVLCIIKVSHKSVILFTVLAAYYTLGR